MCLDFELAVFLAKNITDTNVNKRDVYIMFEQKRISVERLQGLVSEKSIEEFSDELASLFPNPDPSSLDLETRVAEYIPSVAKSIYEPLKNYKKDDSPFDEYSRMQDAGTMSI